MLRRALLCFSCVALCSLSVLALAQEVGKKVVIPYDDPLGMNPLLDGPVVDVESDATNRVWAVAPGRASAALGSARAPLFPIAVADTGLPAPTTTLFTSVAFAVPAGNAGDGEHFYLGSSRGIAWGRLAATVDHGGELVIDRVTPVPEDQVNELASDGSDWLWAATAGGLMLWDLSLGDPASSAPAEFLALRSVEYVAVAPWGEAAAVDGDLLFLVGPTDAVPVGSFYTLPAALGDFRGITFDSRGNLWAITTSLVVLKFDSDWSPASAPTVIANSPTVFPLNHSSFNSFSESFDIAVDPFTGRVWVTMQPFERRTAFHQTPDPLTWDLDLVGGDIAWQTVSTFDQFRVVHADSSGNAWFGMAGDRGEALNGYVVRLLTLNKSRYLGDEKDGVVSLVDLALFGDNGIPDEQTTLTLAVGSDARPFTVTEQGDTGSFSQGFRIQPSGAVGGADNLFQVSSSAADVPVEARYEFTDASDVDRELTATASWANIVKFEDDLWIGSCFLRSLGW